ncbi:MULTISPECIES: helix-turn-helix transcriptional regulator [unclassified Arsukibacterium]|uniref:helix-turn-helix transcriptional regulator n=1 Tax=unclassified Arsukibacterium TaxID=2635278 RepID=UPI000C5039F1|nr:MULTISPECIES: helix-turn-helix domain-containing protein [unclassified Arsukibacterium]MAA96114.1 DNA-binding protein [Rheinheimera sp.]MBM35462.1 DNA-binding protein [Rheinheimera sp.]HAW93622.1 DNA-binding protein [Candidatus Azambacteria bacterium]|tara:strand:+ start:382 stop:579 length:198 start_codon:yes stop_codon:yes gene_type:complete
MKPLFYRIEEIAALLHVSKQTLYNHINHNKKSANQYPIPPHIRINGRLLFPINDFESWVKNQPRN